MPDPLNKHTLESAMLISKTTQSKFTKSIIYFLFSISLCKSFVETIRTNSLFRFNRKHCWNVCFWIFLFQFLFSFSLVDTNRFLENCNHSLPHERVRMRMLFPLVLSFYFLTLYSHCFAATVCFQRWHRTFKVTVLPLAVHLKAIYLNLKMKKFAAQANFICRRFSGTRASYLGYTVHRYSIPFPPSSCHHF